MAVAISVKPGAKRPGISVENGAIVVRVRECAVDGAANEAVVRAVAQHVGVAPRTVAIVRGLLSRSKLVAVAGMNDAALDVILRG